MALAGLSAITITPIGGGSASSSVSTTSSVVSCRDVAVGPSLPGSRSSSIDDDQRHKLSRMSVSSSVSSPPSSSSGISTPVIVPPGWKRRIIEGRIVYFSPSDVPLFNHQDILSYLMTDGTCKCGLDCPLQVNKVFNFDPNHCLQVTRDTSPSSSHCNHQHNLRIRKKLESLRRDNRVSTSSNSSWKEEVSLNAEINRRSIGVHRESSEGYQESPVDQERLEDDGEQDDQPQNLALRTYHQPHNQFQDDDDHINNNSHHPKLPIADQSFSSPTRRHRPSTNPFYNNSQQPPQHPRQYLLQRHQQQQQKQLLPLERPTVDIERQHHHQHLSEQMQQHQQPIQYQIQQSLHGHFTQQQQLRHHNHQIHHTAHLVMDGNFEVENPKFHDEPSNSRHFNLPHHHRQDQQRIEVYQVAAPEPAHISHVHLQHHSIDEEGEPFIQTGSLVDQQQALDLSNHSHQPHHQHHHLDQQVQHFLVSQGDHSIRNHSIHHHHHHHDVTAVTASITEVIPSVGQILPPGHHHPHLQSQQLQEMTHEDHHHHQPPPQQYSLILPTHQLVAMPSPHEQTAVMLSPTGHHHPHLSTATHHPHHPHHSHPQFVHQIVPQEQHLYQTTPQHHHQFITGHFSTQQPGVGQHHQQHFTNFYPQQQPQVQMLHHPSLTTGGVATHQIHSQQPPSLAFTPPLSPSDFVHKKVRRRKPVDSTRGKGPTVAAILSGGGDTG